MAAEEVAVPDGSVTFTLPGGSRVTLEPLDVIEHLDEVRKKLAADGKGWADYYREVAAFLAVRAGEGACPTLELAENFDHALRLHWAKKKKRHGADFDAALPSPSSTAT